MDITNFKNKWLGLRVDVDNVYGAQCTDLIKQYAKELFGITPGSWGNAIQYWTNTNPVLLQRFSRIETTEAQQGDIVVFKTINRTDFSGEGHVGISTGTNTNTQVSVLEQNGSTGNGSGTGKDAIRIRLIDKSRIAGVLRPIVHVVNPPAPVVVAPPQGGLVLPTSGEKYDVVVPIGGYITSNQAANHIQPVRTFQPGSYYIYRKANNMININTLPTGPGAWINPNDNVIPIVVPEPVVQRDPVPLVSNVTVQPSANSVVGSSPITATAVVTPVTTTPTETSVMPDKDIKQPLANWRSTFRPFPSGERDYVYIGESGDKIEDIDGRRPPLSIKLMSNQTVISVYGEFDGPDLITGKIIPYGRISKIDKPDEDEYSYHAIPVFDQDGDRNLKRITTNDITNQQAKQAGNTVFHNLLKPLWNVIAILTRKIQDRLPEEYNTNKGEK